MTSANDNPYPGKSDDLSDDLNLNNEPADADEPVEGDWDDEEDEDFDDQMEFKEDLREIRAGDDIGEPDPEDADHLPDDDLQ